MQQSSDIPFNVRILELTPKKLYGLKPVRSLDIFDGATGNLHEDGLFSVSIFGKPGDDRRDLRFSYIDIKVPIFHPIIYFSLVELKKLYELIMSGQEYAVFNPIINDFEKSNPIEGQTGFTFFLEHWEKIVFKPSKSEQRIDQAKLIEKYKSVALTTKIAVCPAGLRDIEIGDDGRIRKDIINDYYFTFISISNAISDVAVKTNPSFLDNARFKLQQNFNELYNTLENMIKGKKKLFLNKWASRKIQNGTRNVITAMKVDNPELGAPGSIGYNHTAVGLYQALKAALPITKFQLKNNYLSQLFVSPDVALPLIDPETLELSPERVDVSIFDRWTTEEGLDKLISSYSEESIRHNEIKINGKYLALIYKGKDGTFKIFQDINELPPGRDREDVSPITWTELFYVSTQKELNKLPAFVTRYPITGIGSIYPSYTYVKTTVKAEKRVPLDDNWHPIDDITETCYQFPIRGSAFVNALSPHSSKLTGLSADFDGDRL